MKRAGHAARKPVRSPALASVVALIVIVLALSIKDAQKPMAPMAFTIDSSPSDRVGVAARERHTQAASGTISRKPSGPWAFARL